MPHLVQVHESWSGAAFEVVGVSESSADDVAHLQRELALPFGTVAESRARDDFGIALIWGSVFLLVDPEGVVRADTLAGAEERLRAELGAAGGGGGRTP